MKFRKPPKPKVRTEPVTHWGNVARWYDELVGQAGSEYHREVVLPGTIRLLDLNEGDRALDVACGQGVLCRILHRGGVGVTGVDAATELISLARQRSDAGISFHVGDARDGETIGRVGAVDVDHAGQIFVECDRSPG